MNNNYFARRQWLVSVFEDTMQKIHRDPMLQQAMTDSIRSQQFIAETEPVCLPNARYAKPAQVLVTKNRSLEAAARYAQPITSSNENDGSGKRVVVLNFASANRPGGGVENGASAQEECICRVSTLFPCLKDMKMWEMFYAPHRDSHNPLHNDDIIFTPNVLVVKDEDYKELSEPFNVDIITCAAPNLSEVPTNIYNPNDGEVRPVISDDELLKLHEKRGRKILSVAAKNGAEVVILGAFGCGAFHNDPQIVAQAYHNILPEYLHYFQTIEFAVWCRPTDYSNYQAFEKKHYITANLQICS